MNKIYFISFASTNMSKALKRTGKQAKELQLFDKIYLYNEKKLPSYAKKRCKQIIKLTKSMRGYAYWAWKPVIINEVFNKIEDGDIVIYSDAGTHLNLNGKEKLLEYIQIAKENDIWCIQIESGLNDLSWTKMDTINYFRNRITDEKEKISFDQKLHEGQLEAGTIITIKNDYTKKIFTEWESLMTVDNLHLFDDSPSKIENYLNFRENRHDQSIFSLLLKSNHFISIENNYFYSNDEYPNGGWNVLIESSPFLRLRDVNRENLNLIKRIIRKSKKLLNI